MPSSWWSFYNPTEMILKNLNSKLFLNIWPWAPFFSMSKLILVKSLPPTAPGAPFCPNSPTSLALGLLPTPWIKCFPRSCLWPLSLFIYPHSLGKLLQSNVSSNHLKIKDSTIYTHDTLFCSLHPWTSSLNFTPIFPDAPTISYLKLTCIFRSTFSIVSSEAISLSVLSLILSQHQMTPKITILKLSVTDDTRHPSETSLDATSTTSLLMPLICPSSDSHHSYLHHCH